MAYRVPTFNLTCSIDTFGQSGYPHTVQATVCQVRGLKRIVEPLNLQGGNRPEAWVIALPARTYVRGSYQDGVGSVITVGAAYPVVFLARLVFDVAAGFPNEYRTVLCARTGPLPFVLPQ